MWLCWCGQQGHCLLRLGLNQCLRQGLCTRSALRLLAQQRQQQLLLFGQGQRRQHSCHFGGHCTMLLLAAAQLQDQRQLRG